MKEQEKQIEKITIQEMAKEIARVLFEIRQDMTSIVRHIRHEKRNDDKLTLGEFIDRHLKYRELANDASKNILKNLNENNKLKEIENLCVKIARNGLPENAMVLTEEELKNIIQEEYQNALKDKVVLTKEEINNMKYYNYGAEQGYEKGRLFGIKETAEKIYTFVNSFGTHNWKRFKEFIKQFDVEVEE